MIGAYVSARVHPLGEDREGIDCGQSRTLNRSEAVYASRLGFSTLTVDSLPTPAAGDKQALQEAARFGG
jgi:hypothetical protein